MAKEALLTIDGQQEAKISHILGHRVTERILIWCPAISPGGRIVSREWTPVRAGQAKRRDVNEKALIMMGYKEPSFQDRIAVAQSAKNKALAQMNSRAPIDPAERARRIANRAAKDEAERIKRAAAQEAKKAARIARESQQLAKRDEVRLAAEMALAARPRVLDEAELKSARDARYAARKARKTGRP